jgi:hypothetical protein
MGMFFCLPPYRPSNTRGFPGNVRWLTTPLTTGGRGPSFRLVRSPFLARGKASTNPFREVAIAPFSPDVTPLLGRPSRQRICPRRRFGALIPTTGLLIQVHGVLHGPGGMFSHFRHGPLLRSLPKCGICPNNRRLFICFSRYRPPHFSPDILFCLFGT